MFHSKKKRKKIPGDYKEASDESSSQESSKPRVVKFVDTPEIYNKKVDSRRWRVLFVYCFSTIGSIINWNIWTPIAHSALEAFPQWKPSTLELMNNWGSVIFMLFIFPSCKFLKLQGVRTTIIIAVAVSTIGAALRLVQIDRIYTIIVHGSAILNAFGGVLLSPCILPIVAEWFPSRERTIAIGIAAAMTMFGMAVSFVLGPLIVDDVGQQKHVRINERRYLRTEIMILCLIGFLLELILLLLTLFVIPLQPIKPPSRSTRESTEKKDIRMLIPLKLELWELMKDRNFVLLALASACSSGVSGPWLTLLPFLFHDKGVTMKEISEIGFITIIMSALISLATCFFARKCVKQLKSVAITYLLVSGLTFIPILLMEEKVITTTDLLWVEVVLGLSLIWATMPLFYTMAIEHTYPVDEGTVGGVLITASNLITFIIYLPLQLFPNSDIGWMTYALVISLFGCMLMLCFVTVKYRRLTIDE